MILPGRSPASSWLIQDWRRRGPPVGSLDRRSVLSILPIACRIARTLLSGCMESDARRLSCTERLTWPFVRSVLRHCMGDCAMSIRWSGSKERPTLQTSPIRKWSTRPCTSVDDNGAEDLSRTRQRKPADDCTRLSAHFLATAPGIPEREEIVALGELGGSGGWRPQASVDPSVISVAVDRLGHIPRPQQGPRSACLRHGGRHQLDPLRHLGRPGRQRTARHPPGPLSHLHSRPR